MTYDLVRDYSAALDSLPEAQEERQKEREHEERVRSFTGEMIAYVRAWNDARNRHAEDPRKCPMPRPDDIPLPQIIPSVRPWTDEEIRRDTERIINNPSRLDRVRAFSQFVNCESHVLAKYGSRAGFCLQHAHNSARSDPVARAAEPLVELERKQPLLLRMPSRRPQYKPHPALL